MLDKEIGRRSVLAMSGAVLAASLSGSSALAQSSKTLSGKRIAILMTDGFEKLEMTLPRAAFDAAGAETVLIAPRGPSIKAWDITDWGDDFQVERELSAARPTEFDALHLPGGAINPDRLRRIPEAVAFVRAMFDANKPVSVLCHGPWTLIEAGVVKGRTLTSWGALQTDIQNAGGNWVNRAVVRDGNLVSGRHPADVNEFNPQAIRLFAGVS